MSGRDSPAAAPAESEQGPRWVSDGLRASAAELALFGRTALAFTVRPSRAAHDWGTGELRAANPLAFLATSAAVVQPIRALAMHLLGWGSDDSLAGQVLSALGPFVHYAAVGLLCHLFLRWTRRGPARRASDAVGLALFAGGGPAALGEILFWAALVLAARSIGLSAGAAAASLGGAFTIFCVSFATSLGSLYRAGAARIFLAFMFAFMATGLVFGALEPPGHYGMHWVVTVAPAAISVRW